MITRYPAKREYMFGILLLSIIAITWIPVLYDQNLFFISIAIVITALFVWIWLGTSYDIREDYLLYRSGPIKGKIRIDNIKELSCNVHAWTGKRFALSFNYLKIRYNVNDDLYIAPKDDKRFIEDLKKVNSNIALNE